MRALREVYHGGVQRRDRGNFGKVEVVDVGLMERLPSREYIHRGLRWR